MRRLATTLIAGLLCGTLSAQEYSSGILLSLPPEARAAAMAEAYSAQSAGAHGLWYNPATLARASGSTLSLSHALFLEDISWSSVGFGFPFGNQNALGVGFQQVTYGSVSSYDRSGVSVGSYAPKDILGRVGYAKTFTKTSVGVAWSYLKSQILNSASTLAMNAGVHQELGPLLMGLSMENLGGGLSYRSQETPLDRRYRTGLSCRLLPMWRFNVDAVNSSTNGMGFSTGNEIKVETREGMTLVFRGGYNTQSGKELSGLKGVAGGLGISLDWVDINYAWVPFGDFGITHRFSLDINFAGLAEEREGKSLLSSIKMNPSLRARERKIRAPKDKSRKGLSIFPWNFKRGWKRTSDEHLANLLAQDALCLEFNPYAVLSRTQGRVDLFARNNSKLKKRVLMGDYAFESDRIQTRAGSYAHMVLPNFSRVEVKEESKVIFHYAEEVCEKPILDLEEGGLYQETSVNKKLVVKTPGGEIEFERSKAQVFYRNNELEIQMMDGSGAVTVDDRRINLKPNTLFRKKKDSSAYEYISLDPENVVTQRPLTPANSAVIPGRWDQGFSSNFKSDVLALEKIPGVNVAEFVRDSNIREDLRQKILDQKQMESDMQGQLASYQEDFSQFEQMIQDLSLKPNDEKRTDKKLRFDNLKQAKRALKNARISFDNIRKDLKKLLAEIRKNQEYQAVIPIVRMLNITAQESTIPFDTGRSIIPEEAMPTLDAIVNAMKRLQPYRVVVEGHTDKTGAPEVNVRLSKSRAQAVTDFLRRQTNIPARSFMTFGRGSTQPLNDGDAPEELRQNRRVEIWLELRGL